MQEANVKYGENTVNRLSENTDKTQQLRDMPIGEQHAFFIPILEARSVRTMAGNLKYEAGHQLYESIIDRSIEPPVDVKLWRTA
jgi:hypothetical protein